MTHYSYTYGSLTTFMLLLIWMYICILILFLGAEFNSLIEKNILRPWRISKHSKKAKKQSSMLLNNKAIFIIEINGYTDTNDIDILINTNSNQMGLSH